MKINKKRPSFGPFFIKPWEGNVGRSIENKFTRMSARGLTKKVLI